MKLLFQTIFQQLYSGRQRCNDNVLYKELALTLLRNCHACGSDEASHANWRRERRSEWAGEGWSRSWGRCKLLPAAAITPCLLLLPSTAFCCFCFFSSHLHLPLLSLSSPHRRCSSSGLKNWLALSEPVAIIWHARGFMPQRLISFINSHSR